MHSLFRYYEININSENKISQWMLNIDFYYKNSYTVFLVRPLSVCVTSFGILGSVIAV